MKGTTNNHRRTLLKTGVLALSGALGSAELTPAAAATTDTAAAPRERLLMDFGWQFKLGHGSDPLQDLNFGFGQSDFAKTGDFAVAKEGFPTVDWRTLDLPHDWAVELPFVRDEAGEGDAQLRSHGFKPLGRRYPATSVGWYRREFELPASDAGRRIGLEFDGVIRHVWLCKSDALNLGSWDSTVRPTIKGGAATLALGALVHNEGSVPERTRHESDQAGSRALFNGLAQLIVRAGRRAGDIVVEAAAESQLAGIKPARIVIAARPAQARPALA